MRSGVGNGVSGGRPAFPKRFANFGNEDGKSERMANEHATQRTGVLVRSLARHFARPMTILSRITHPTLAWRLGASWLAFAIWIAVLFASNSGVTASPFLLVFFLLRWGTERYKHGEPRFFRLFLFSLVALLLGALVFFGPSDRPAITFHPFRVAILIFYIFFSSVCIYRDYLIATGRVTLEPPRPADEEVGRMTVNERLVAGGVLDEWDDAVRRRSRPEMIEILRGVAMTEQQAAQTTDAVLQNAKK